MKRYLADRSKKATGVSELAMIPLSSEYGSLGNPAMFHVRTLTASIGHLCISTTPVPHLIRQSASPHAQFSGHTGRWNPPNASSN